MKHFLIVLMLWLGAPVQAASRGAVASADPRATAAGQEMLDGGGSAADAAMAMMLALGVVEPQSSGIGGGGFIVYHDARKGEVATIDGRETAPASATRDRFLGPDGKPLPFVRAFPGGRSVGVPGNVALMARTHARWGKLPWARLFEPAIRLAEGYQVSRRMAGFLQQVAPVMKDFPASTALFWENGAPKPQGAMVRNPALAATLRAIARGGSQAFYGGPIAREIVTAVRQAPRSPGDMTEADLANYRARDRAALCRPYRVYRVCTMGPASGGGATVLQILGLIERFPMGRLGPNDPVAWHVIGEAMQLAYADRDRWIGDSDFVPVPLQGLLDRDYVARRSALIRLDSALGTYAAGDPPGATATPSATSGERSGTTHFVAVDGAGNVASMTSTVEASFGSQLVAAGFVLNNELTDFSFAPTLAGTAAANAVAGGKRPLSSMSPVIVYLRGRPVLALGSAGGRRIPMHVLKTLVGVLDWRLDAERAMALPNIYFGGQALLVEQGTALAAMQAELARLGQTVVVAEATSKLTAVERTLKGWRAVIDPRIGVGSLIE